jgi:zinc/manganese transport system substrate-binding protein
MNSFPKPRHPASAIAAAALVSLALVLCACSSAASPGGNSLSVSSGNRVIEVVAAENFWGSIAAQIGGKHVHVISIITNPNTDPHAYEPTAADGRTMAGAQMVIENGIGYDPWVPQLLKSAGSTATVLNVGDLLGVADGGNPHRWYNPTDTQMVIAQITADYQKLDPADTAYFGEQESAFNTVALKPYDGLLASIKSTYGGAPVGASESIFSMLAPALGLDLITPPSFLTAISEGSEVTAADKQTIDAQIQQHQIKIYVYNSQNVTPDVQAQLDEVKAAHIPYATITETLQPPGSTYQAWQTRQLVGIQAALAQATG